ncbi:hypothetical protein ACB092_03G245000 [Castanea dentata]
MYVCFVCFGVKYIIFLWLSGMYFRGARFSNYEAWLSDPTHIGPSAQVVWPIVGQEILNGDVGGAYDITNELQLYCTAIGALFHYHKAAPKLAWFQDVESMLNHHLAGLLGLGSLSWVGHQVYVSLLINQFLIAGVDPKEIPLPHDLEYDFLILFFHVKCAGAGSLVAKAATLATSAEFDHQRYHSTTDTGDLVIKDTTPTVIIRATITVANFSSPNIGYPDQ